ncbi:MAG: BREX system P-loop protein BrxC [Desulfoplanes sp.]
MINQDIYLKNPAEHKLVNEGVASVNDDQTEHSLAVLRYEVETFVCDGQYEKGMAHILDTYLRNLDQAQQPGVWISGFYGSGKSHLAKMLRALWLNTQFSDGATAQGIAHLPQNIRDILKELSIQSKRHGGLHAASGTLKSNDERNSVRTALLAIIFRSVGLPTKYHLAMFVMWLTEEGILDTVRSYVLSKGKTWEGEVQRLHVSKIMREALVQAQPDVFYDEKTCSDILRNQFPSAKDVTSEDMLNAIRQALSKDGKFPLTLIVLDEIQQYIGEDSQRSIDVQETVEACCKNIGSKMLFIGTGQTAVTGTSNLKKLQGRFTVRVELSDADVDTVIRKVILAKKPEAASPIDQVMQNNLGEISRHLTGTTIGHRQDDIPSFPQDYPILPVRRRFWENILRVLDQTGTDSQLRNQLSMVHKVIQTNLQAPLGNVVPADYIYFDSADKLLQYRILPRKVYEKTLSWINGSEDEQLMSRACGMVFLINKLAAADNEIGIRATVDTLGDLLVENLSDGSGAIRNTLPSILDQCELLMKVGDEYRIQTEESTAWTDEFLSQRSRLANEAYRIEAEREDRIRKKFGQAANPLSLVQGASKISRTITPVFNSVLPGDADERLYVWVRNGWDVDENSVQADARQAGNQSPTVFVFIPKRSSDDLHYFLRNFKAASATLEIRGVPGTPEGIEARSSMETTKQTAEGRIEELLQDAFSGARVFQGGGNEILGNDLRDLMQEAGKNALIRLYPHFQMADHAGWSKVYDLARKGAPDALKAVGDNGEPDKNPVCKAVLNVIGAGKKGTEIREQFEGSPYGWSRDAVDGGLQVLLTAELVLAKNERGQGIAPKDLERKTIGKTFFKMESTTITTVQRIQIRKLFQKAGLNVKQNEESAKADEFLNRIYALAEDAGGDPPCPASPDTTFLERARLSSGNEQLLEILSLKNQVTASINDWTDTAQRMGVRLPEWRTLKDLAVCSGDLHEARNILEQITTIENERLLLADPDHIAPLITSLTQMLREKLNQLDADYAREHARGMEILHADANWNQLDPEQHHQLMSDQQLDAAAKPEVSVQSTMDILETLGKCSLSSFADRVAALASRFNTVTQKAAELCEPEAQFIRVPRCTLKTEKDVDTWAEEVTRKLKTALGKGPVVIQ